MERCRTKPAKRLPDDSKLAGGRSASKRGHTTTAVKRALCALVLVAVGCGGARGAKQPEAPVLAKANTVALGEMVQGVEAAKQKSGQDEAIERLKAAVAKDPGLWEAQYNLGVLLAKKGSFAEAEPHLAKAAQLSPNSEDVALALGEVRRRGGKLDQAAD